MSNSIRRDGTWWNRQDDGTWLRWNDDAEVWEPSSAPPPPPPSPPPSASTEPIPVTSPPGVANTSELPVARGRYKTYGPPVLMILLGLLLLGLAGVAFLSVRDDRRSPAVAPRDLPRASKEGPAAPTPTELSDKAAYIATLDTICARVLAAQDALRDPRGRRGLIRYTTKAYRLNRAALSQMRKVPLPDEGRAIAERLLFLYAKAIGHIERGIDAARRDDAYSFGRALAHASRAGRKYNAIATAYGFQRCNEDE